MKRNLFLLSHVFIMTLGISLGLSSCKNDDDPDPEIVTDETAYYIAGDVSSGGKPLEGVKVSVTATNATTATDGTFELKVSEKGDYSVTFSKDGYVTVTADVTIASNAKNKSSVLIKQVLTKKKDPVTVKPDEDINIYDEVYGVNLFIPAGALSGSTNITMTAFLPGESNITAGTLLAGLVSLNLEPEGLVFNKPVTLTLENRMGKDVHFGNMKHVIEANGTRKIWDDITYDSEKERYTITLTGFSNHTFAVGVKAVKGGTSTEALDTKVIDNLGKYSAVSDSVTTTQEYGWVMGRDVRSDLKAKYSLLADAAIDALATNIITATSSLMGSGPGTGEVSLTIPFKVSGDVKLTINYLTQLQMNTFSFPLIFANGSEDWVDISVKRYLGTQVNTTYQYGSSYPDHSGGSGS